MNRFHCACCGYRTLEEPPNSGSFEVCPVCGWEDEEFVDPGEEWFGANSVTLVEARESFDRTGACDPYARVWVRPPCGEELLRVTWQGNEPQPAGGKRERVRPGWFCVSDPLPPAQARDVLVATLKQLGVDPQLLSERDVVFEEFVRPQGKAALQYWLHEAVADDDYDGTPDCVVRISPGTVNEWAVRISERSRAEETVSIPGSLSDVDVVKLRVHALLRERFHAEAQLEWTRTSDGAEARVWPRKVRSTSDS